MTPDSAQLKHVLRQELRARNRAALADRAAASKALCDRLEASAAWQQAKALLLYHPLPDEPDILPLLELAWSSGRVVALPRYDSARAAYEPARVDNPASDLTEGRFGLPEPAAKCPATPLNQLDLVIIPGIGFDPAGRRLGRGKGFYDRLLAGMTGIKLGLAFDWQVADALPGEPHDVVMDAVLTPTRWLKPVPPRG